jgi:pimeloyl-ACP methyl ester carboxylesterase
MKPYSNTKRRSALWRILGLWGLLLSVALFVGVLSMITLDKPVADLKAKWGAAPSQFMRIDGLDVHVCDEGPRTDPTPVVLIHGTSSSLHTWDAWAEGLKTTRRVIRFDLPAFGLTGPAVDHDYSMVRYVRFVDEVLKALDVQRAVIAGNSLGGQIAWEFAATHPSKAAGLVLIDAAGFALNSTSVPLGFRLARMPGVRHLVAYLLPPQTIERSLKNVYGDAAKVTPELIDRYTDLTLREGNRHAVVKRFEQVLTSDASRLMLVKAPTLILWGGKDQLIPPVHAQQFKKALPMAEVKIFDALGHVPMEEDPAATLVVFKSFLGRI